MDSFESNKGLGGASRKVEFIEIIALILDLEEVEAVVLVEKGEVDSIVEEVEDLVPSLSKVICKSLLVCGNFCRNPTLKKCEDDTHTPEMGTWESSKTPRKFRVRFQRSKDLALGCSLYRWKGLETYMSKMASHEPFGHLKHKLCTKEGPGVKLTI